MRLLLTTLMIISVPAFVLAGPSIVGTMTTPAWNPGDPAFDLSPLGDDGYALTVTLPAGPHESKVNETDAWEGTDWPGFNIYFELTEETSVTFFANLGANVGVKNFDEYVAHQNPILAGSFIDLWGGNNWDPADATGEMEHVVGTDLFILDGILPAGSYECKVTLNGDWGQDTGPNTAFDLTEESVVTFTYDFGTNTLILDMVVPTEDGSLSEVKRLY
jgi:hypothetical protein